MVTRANASYVAQELSTQSGVCRRGYSLLEALREYTGTSCSECGAQVHTAHQLCMHAKYAHGLQVCGTCLRSGRFFGNELELRDGPGMSVRSRFLALPLLAP